MREARRGFGKGSCGDEVSTEERPKPAARNSLERARQEFVSRRLPSSLSAVSRKSLAGFWKSRRDNWATGGDLSLGTQNNS